MTQGWVIAFVLAAASPTPSPDIRIDDVARFYAVYEAAQGRPTAQQLQQQYLAKASPGLVEFARLRRITGERIAAAITDRPAVFADARRCAEVMPAAKIRIAEALASSPKSIPRPSFRRSRLP
jgi:hypothetical protein